eukprot:PhF_6_TR38996/c0_g1_i1/m.58356
MMWVSNVEDLSLDDHGVHRILRPWITLRDELTIPLQSFIGPKAYAFHRISETLTPTHWVRQIQHRDTTQNAVVVHAIVLVDRGTYEGPFGQPLRTLGVNPIGRTLLYGIDDATGKAKSTRSPFEFSVLNDECSGSSSSIDL